MLMKEKIRFRDKERWFEHVCPKLFGGLFFSTILATLVIVVSYEAEYKTHQAALKLAH